MTDDQMTELERRLERRLRAHAEIPVAPANSLAIAHEVMAISRRRGVGSWFASLRAPLRLAIVAALLAALVVGLLAAGGAFRISPIVDASLAPSATASAPPAPGVPLQDGIWLADQPADLSFGDSPGRGRIMMTFDANVKSLFVTTSTSGGARVFDAFVDQVPGSISLEGRAAGSPVTVGGSVLPGCAVGDVATYRHSRSADGLHLTLSVVLDVCPARAAVLGRTWVRSLGGVNNGGLGVVDALDQLFSVELPSGAFSVERYPGSIMIIQAIPELQLMVVENPDGYSDPCDPGAARTEIAPTADAFVEYFRQLPGFTVESTSELLVDGHRAVRLATKADLDSTCPSGQLYEWRAGADPTDFGWFLRPGDVDSLYLVELPGSTLLFELLPPPHPQEAEVIASIRFLDELPAQP